MPTVTVIIPAYNVEAFIDDALASVFAQTHQPDQIVVVNDGSTDGTARRLARHSDPRLTVIDKRNGGISSARNHGLAVATGDYIAMLDGDDRWHPEMLAQQVAVMEAHPELVCAFTNFTRFDDRSGKSIGDQFQDYPDLLHLPSEPGPLPQTRVLTTDAFSSLIAFGEIPCFMQVTIFRARILAGMMFNESLHLGEDYEFALRAYLRGRVAVNERPLAEVRRHETNTTKDHLWFPVYKLQAFLALKPWVVEPRHQPAYHDRLVKAHIDAACVHARRSRWARGLKVLVEGFVVPGSPMRKGKGTVRFLLTAGQRLAGRA